MGNMCFPQEINSSSFVSMTLIILSAKQNFSMHNIKCDIGTQHVRMHTHTHIHRHNYIYISICTHSPVLRSSLVARSSLQRLPRVPALEWSWTSRCHGLTHTLSLFVARPPPPSPSRFPLPCSPLLCSSSLCLKCNKTPPPTTKKSQLGPISFLKLWKMC